MSFQLHDYPMKKFKKKKLIQMKPDCESGKDVSLESRGLAEETFYL